MQNKDNKQTGSDAGDTGYYYYGNLTSTAPQITYKESTLPMTITNISSTLVVSIGSSHITASTINFTANLTGKGVVSIGASSTAEDADLIVNGTQIGTYVYDVMTPEGVIVRTPKANLGSDKIHIDVPAKDGVEFRVQMIIGGTGTTVTGTGATSTLESVATVKAPIVTTDDKVTNAAASNLILVGGPCVNTLTAEKLGLTFPACMDASGYKEGEGYITLRANGDKVALIVAGWSAAETTQAAAMLKDYAANKAKLIGAEVKVVNTQVTTATTEPTA
jgi:hypothetical protein